jgi:AcrR family transcriptional regulator
MSEQTFSRSYHSELRAEQAQRTRERIMQAAAHEFGTSGYQATTMAAIARSAGVSTETVKAAGSKAELLIRSFETVFALQEGADSLADSPAAAGLLDAREATVLNGVIASANARSRRLWTQLVAASLSDRLVDQALQRLLASRRRDYRLLVDELDARGLVRPDVDAELAAAELSFLMSPEGYQQLVDQTGWTETRYREWLTAAVRRTIG